jgi:peptidoglycan-associated lipoprotein
MYNKLRADDWLAPLDEALKGDAKKIKEFVSPTLLSAVQEKGVTYAIPNNNPIGEYTYMCLNKELMDKYSLQGHIARGSIKNFANEYVYQFIDQIARYGSEDLLPIDATYEECLAQLAYYWNVDPETYAISNDEFSVFGTPLFDLQPNRGQNIVGVQSLFENEEFTKHYLALNEYRLEDAYRFKYDASSGEYYEDAGEGKEIVFFRNEENKDQTYAQYGIKFVKGTLATLNEKGNYVENGVEYYAIPVAYPQATAEDIYGNMFAVAKTTLSVERSMQIITYLNTNSEIRNLLQYGIEGQHYTVQKTVTEDGENVKIVKRNADKQGNEYVMDIYATGNAFLAHVLDEEDMDTAIWANGKKQNRDSLVEPLLGFNLAEYAETATQFGIPTTIPVTKMYSTTFRSNLSKDDLVILTDLNFPVIYFPYDSNKLVDSEMKKIEKVAEYLNKYSSLLLIVEGHCDQRGTEEYNRSLGERRANMIRESLVAAGVNSDRIRTVSYGKDRPAVEGNDESAWGKNRRGELLPAKKK